MDLGVNKYLTDFSGQGSCYLSDLVYLSILTYNAMREVVSDFKKGGSLKDILALNNCEFVQAWVQAPNRMYTLLTLVAAVLEQAKHNVYNTCKEGSMASANFVDIVMSTILIISEVLRRTKHFLNTSLNDAFTFNATVQHCLTHFEQNDHHGIFVALFPGLKSATTLARFP